MDRQRLNIKPLVIIQINQVVGIWTINNNKNKPS